jgi:hypothetical protein
MLSRTLKFAAVSAGILAAAALAAAPTGARAADECLTAPKGATPAGAHWYYRLEKGTKRKCWYLADEVSKATKPTPAAVATEASADEPAPPAAKPKATHNTATRNTTARQSVADARAELTTPEDDQPALDATTWPPLEHVDPVRAPAPADPPAADPAMAAAPQGWTMAARWPESNAGSAGSNPPDERTAAALRNTAAPQDAATDPLRIALIVLTAALLAAALAGRLLLRRVRRTPRPTPPRAIWPDQRADHPDASRADVAEIEALLRASRGATG